MTAANTVWCATTEEMLTVTEESEQIPSPTVFI